MEELKNKDNNGVTIRNLRNEKAWKEFIRARDLKKMQTAGMFMYVWEVVLKTHPAWRLEDE